jgi:hypothetical protein
MNKKMCDDLNTAMTKCHSAKNVLDVTIVAMGNSNLDEQVEPEWAIKAARDLVAEVLELLDDIDDERADIAPAPGRQSRKRRAKRPTMRLVDSAPAAEPGGAA